MSSKVIITDPCDFTWRPLKTPSGEPISVFPPYEKFPAYSCDSGSTMGIDKEKFFATRLGKEPGKDDENLFDLFHDGASGSEYINKKNMVQVHGHKYLLTAETHNEDHGGDTHNNKPDGNEAFTMNSRATIDVSSRRIGGGIGSKYGNLEVTKGRWICPIGCQFQWSDLQSGKGNHHHAIDKFYFLFQERHYYKLQWAPLIHDFKFQDDQNLNYYSGKSIVDKNRTGDDRSADNNVRAFLKKSDIAYLRSHRCALVGMIWWYAGEDASGNLRDKATQYYKWKFLFQEKSMPHSAAIYPAETTMYDYLEAEQMRLV